MAVMKDDIDNGKIAFVAVVGAIIVLAMIFLVQAFYFTMEEKQRPVKASQGIEWRGYASEQQAKLNSYGWVDQSKGVVRIPVERAISLVVAEHQAQRQGSTDDGAPAGAPGQEMGAAPAGAGSGSAAAGRAAAGHDGSGHDGSRRAVPAHKGNGHKPARGATTVQAGGTQP